MGRLDRYILKTAGGAFFAVLLVLTSMVWVTTALRQFNLLTSQGQTVWVFLYVTALSLPTLMVVVAPIALFLAIVFTLHRLNSDSELVAMSAAGASPWQLFRAPLLLSIAVAMVSMLISAELSASSLRSLRNQLANVNADVVANVAQPGRFTRLSGITFHVRERGPNGALLGIFIDDARDRTQTTTYLADRGRIVPSGSALILVLEDGSIQRGRGSGRNSSIVEFERYGFDLSQFDPTSAVANDRAAFRSIGELLWPRADDKLSVQDADRFRVELHKRLSTPLYPIAAFVIAFAFLGSPRTTRQSRGLSIAGASGVFLFVEVLGLGSSGLVERSAAAAPIPYVVPLGAIAVGMYTILGNVQGGVPEPLQRFADAIVARIEKAQAS
ncbi:MAG TPA: LPS export ABC transporter permease LptF [Xanthobacteraceae bacterium]|nr:LPS export ABC transporter permease LptF [Xanthobacteraceae bacterium]